MIAAEGRCPCGLGVTYDLCCARVHRNERQATTAEQLMRSRYSAFAFGDAEYVLRSWHPATRPQHIDFEVERQWVQLEILATSDGGMLDTQGTVEFRAHYQQGDERDVQHEISRFVRHDGRWVYVGAID